MVKIIKGTFARVSSGNCTQSWMIDGDDIQARADAAMDSYFGSAATVYERGVEGYGIQVDGSAYIVGVYTSLEAAENHMLRVGKSNPTATN